MSRSRRSYGNSYRSRSGESLYGNGYAHGRPLVSAYSMNPSGSKVDYSNSTARVGAPATLS